ncbi:hypothetical protein LNP18_06180 [Leuconostoc citreum]|uniref:hypothetical protein n=1 Tax=Leuconostoc citreum TaxID=33964 RepID=UPI002009DDCE|nr:hypothetical protein [Leuconostoc citreum]MCK8605690.1 hypothetical protein [Leuconostoc citreum]
MTDETIQNTEIRRNEIDFIDDFVQSNLHAGLSGLTKHLPKLKDALVNIKSIQFHLIKKDIDQIMFSLPICTNVAIHDLCSEYFDCDFINFLANVDDLIQEVDRSITGTNDYYDTLNNIMYPDR